MKMIVVLLIMLNIIYYLEGSEQECFMGTYSVFITTEEVFVIKSMTDIRVIVLIHNKIGPKVTYDHTFQNMTIDDDNIQLIEKSDKYTIYVNLNNSIYKDFGYTEEYNRTFELIDCNLEEIISVVNYAYFLKTREMIFERITFMKKAARIRGKYYQESAYLEDLGKIMNEKDFKTEMDSFLTNFIENYNINQYDLPDKE